MCGRGRQVVKTSTLHVSTQDIEDRGHRSRWFQGWHNESPTVQHVIYNIKSGLFENTCRPVKKRTCWTWPDVFSSPPHPPKKNHPQHTQKRLPIKLPFTSVLTQVTLHIKNTYLPEPPKRSWRLSHTRLSGEMWHYCHTHLNTSVSWLRQTTLVRVPITDSPVYSRWQGGGGRGECGFRRVISVVIHT